LKPGKPKRPLINHPPKKPCEREINAVTFASDEDSDDNYTSDNSELDTDDQAKEFYR
jgi:hypothetical protein